MQTNFKLNSIRFSSTTITIDRMAKFLTRLSMLAWWIIDRICRFQQYNTGQIVSRMYLINTLEYHTSNQFRRFIDRGHIVQSQLEDCFWSNYGIKHLLPTQLCSIQYAIYIVGIILFVKHGVISICPCLSLVFGCFEFFISRVDIYVRLLIYIMD